jgi:hypothetical protein
LRVLTESLHVRMEVLHLHIGILHASIRAFRLLTAVYPPAVNK